MRVRIAVRSSSRILLATLPPILRNIALYARMQPIAQKSSGLRNYFLRNLGILRDASGRRHQEAIEDEYEIANSTLRRGCALSNKGLQPTGCVRAIRP